MGIETTPIDTNELFSLREKIEGILSQLRPTLPQYCDPTIPFYQAFENIEPLFDVLPDFVYIVEFISIATNERDAQLLNTLDHEAYLIAQKYPELLGYYSGILQSDGSCRSFCIWTSETAAKASSRSDQHLRAIGFTAQAYKVYVLRKYAGKKSSLDGRNQMVFTEI